jgi:hypothetical protein
MVENKKLKLLSEKKSLEESAEYVKVGYKKGFPIEKGIVLNEDYLLEHKDDIAKTFEYFSAYPDLFIDLITPEDDNF